jgi:hypothetical protein
MSLFKVRHGTATLVVVGPKQSYYETQFLILQGCLKKQSLQQ